MGEEDNEETGFLLVDFIDTHANLFIVMGVFAASAVYFTDFSEGGISESHMITQAGFAGSLLLTVLIIVLIYYKMYLEMGEDSILEAHTPSRNPDLLIFSTGIFVISLSFLYRISFFDGAVYILFIAVALVGAMGTSFSLLSYVEEPLFTRISDSYNDDEILIPLLGIPGSILVAYSTASAIRYLNSQISLVKLGEFTLSNFTSSSPTLILLFLSVVQTMVAMLCVISAIAFTYVFLQSVWKRVVLPVYAGALSLMPL